MSRRIAVIALLLIAGCVLLAYARRAPDPDLNGRTVAVARTIRCPVCGDLSVADSTAPMARTMRRTILHQLRDGATDDQARDYFVGRYGDWILLEPSAHGLGAIVWIVPLAALVVASLATAGWIRSRPSKSSSGRREAAAEATVP